MNKIHVLDCTLRDGGYCNQWKFGKENIDKIIYSLAEANIDVIECGFITNKKICSENETKFNNISEIDLNQWNKKYDTDIVAMINYGEYEFESLPEKSNTSIQGIRVAFHKKDMFDAIKACKIVKDKGYKLFVQPMVSLNYSDVEFLNLIELVNNINPYAFYIVDSFGVMKPKDLLRLFYLVEHNLKKSIWIGFHSHNNLQLSYSNAQALCGLKTSRNIIIDSSILGMGRGAGNLNTELFLEYLNDTFNKKYCISPIINVIDDVINHFYSQSYWGYSLPNYLSAIHNIHPNYASYLDDKKTLNVEEIAEIFTNIDDSHKHEFNSQYIEEVYQKYMNKELVKVNNTSDFKKLVNENTVVLIAPGKSSYEERKKIIDTIDKEKAIVISINHNYHWFDVDFIFVSNLRRIKHIDNSLRSKCIISSNIMLDEYYLQEQYVELTNDVQLVKDNAGLMAIKLLLKYNPSKIYLAGFDGYSYNMDSNYSDKSLSFFTKTEKIDDFNEAISSVIKRYSENANIIFLTKSKYQEI